MNLLATPFVACRRLPWLLCMAALICACQTPPPLVEGLTPEQVSALQKIGFEETGEGWELDLGGRVLFESGETRLSDENRATIARLVKLLMETGIYRLSVEGYADNTGSERYNQELSLTRAETVAREVEKNGLPYENITIHGQGISNPVADNATRAGRAQNRRVVLIVPAQ
jgi:outer membrane protein OmpA-like peptidoglycan-associated protein